MLNCCIERKKARDEGKRGSVSDRSPGGSSGDAGKGADHSGDNSKEIDKEKEVGKSWESWSDSEEEFFECLSDTEDLKGNGQENGKKGGTKEGSKEPVNCLLHSFSCICCFTLSAKTLCYFLSVKHQLKII